MDVSDIEESPGVVSSMRKNLKTAVRTGVMLAFSGVLLAFAMLLASRYDLVPVSIALITGGPALIGVGLGAKAWQAQGESRTSIAQISATSRGDVPINPPAGA
jgi:hypothetical protein